ncbi:hypothetical protein [Clostridium sp. BL-8]|uniref:hypothetical protein n=1 Tax=Clostridium sp. BL-8 TaxID=349938 RepID=UPI00098C033F|nr:hypothetical protein [Clostridium sp. BL-8]OOM73419.1 hypothetical protein CLOBL_47160 [Clostridium sp. BL-8]
MELACKGRITHNELETLYHSKGVGTFVTKEIVKIGFKGLGLNRIILTASEKNIGEIKAYKKAVRKNIFL